MKRITKNLCYLLMLTLLAVMFLKTPAAASSRAGMEGMSLSDMEELGKYLETILGLFGNTEVPIKNAKVEAIPNQTYTGKAIKPTLKVTYDGKTLKRGTDYTLTYSNNTNVGTAKCTLKGKGDFTGTKTVSFKIVKGSAGSSKSSGNSSKSQGSSSGSGSKTAKSTGKFTLKLTKDEVTCNGKVQKPAVKVLCKGKSVPKSDYTVTYKDNKNVGKATITVTGKGDYKGYTGETTFKIMPAKPTLSSVKGAEGGIAVSWKKAIQADSYQIEYCTRKAFSGTTSTQKADAKDTSALIGKLTAGKKYYIRIRTCVKVGSRNWYSEWSSIKEAVAK